MPGNGDPPAPAGFTWNAADYNKNSAAQHQWAGELIAKLALHGDERVLDLGCGDGKITAAIARSVPRGSVVGIDSSADMIRFAREHFPQEQFSNLSFLQGDAQYLDFHDEFDLVFSNAALHWICDHHNVLTGIRNSLHRGGKMVIQMGGKGNAASVLEIFEEMRTDPAWRSFFTGFSFRYGFFGPEEYRGWLIEAGLSPVRLELLTKDMAYSSRGDFAGWLRTTWIPYLQRVPEDLRPVFVSTIIDRFLARNPPDGNGGIHIGMKRLEVEAGLPDRS